jgi:hypothetical protein
MYSRYLLTYLPTHWLTDLITYFMEQSPSWEANRFAASQEIPRIFMKTESSSNILTSARHLSLSWANSIQSPQLPPTYRRSGVHVTHPLTYRILINAKFPRQIF